MVVHMLVYSLAVYSWQYQRLGFFEAFLVFLRVDFLVVFLEDFFEVFLVAIFADFLAAFLVLFFAVFFEGVGFGFSLGGVSFFSGGAGVWEVGGLEGKRVTRGMMASDE